MAVIETALSSAPKVQIKENDDVSVIILLEKNFGEMMKPYDMKIWGKKMWEWIAMACEGYGVKTMPCTPESDVLSLIKPLLSGSRYTVVLYSDTPLFKRQTLNEIVSYCIGRDLNVLKLKRGYVFNTEYVRNAESIQALQMQDFGDDDFMLVDNFLSFSKATEILKSRIITYHLQNGVLILDPKTTFIDADVIIEHGTIIEPNNYIKGTSYIGRNCRIEFGNVVENSIISDGCILRSSSVTESRISENTVVGPFENVFGKSS